MMLIKSKLFSIIHEASHLPCVGKERVTLTTLILSLSLRDVLYVLH